MHPFNRPHIRIRQQGQTLIIALIVMGVLLILGLVFLGLINRNILNAARSQRRSESTDLAEAGIRYAHGQLVSSPLGADWRGIPETLTPTVPNGNVTGDPDAYYLRPGSLPLLRLSNGANDLGGPDGYGPYVRIPFPGGRALVRVRYGAADASPTKVVAGGPLRNLGAARSMIIIEGVGRTGVVNKNDPTTFNAVGGLQYKGFTTEAELTAGLAAMAQADGQQPTSRRMVAYVPIGIIDAARFETNVFNSSAPIELGIAEGLGASAFNDVDNRASSATVGNVPVDNLEMVLGTPGDVTVGRRNALRYGGSLIANGDVLLHGILHTYLNRTLGDTIRVAGRIYGQSGSKPATLRITPVDYTNAGGFVAGTQQNLTDAGTGVGVTGSFNSQRSNFNTASGLVYDGSPRTDAAGFASGVGILVPPSTQTVDPQTKLNRYVALTRESGAALSGAANSGQYGHGGGVYVDNVSDRQEALDAEGRKTVGSQQSLFDDILHPNSGQANSGWKGPFYVPRGAVVQLLSDGFLIQRDGSAPADERTWKKLDGSDSGLSTIRYRLGQPNPNGPILVLDTITAKESLQDINATTLDFTKGLPFNGVLYFEGNARVRGTIPTGVQLTLVSGATVYIDGPITKGVVTNDVVGHDSASTSRGVPIKSLPTAALMLMAKDNVIVNTTMFFGPSANQVLESVNDVNGATTINPVRIRAAGGGESGQLETLLDLALDPNTAAAPTSQVDPSTWDPYAMTYQDFDTGSAVPTNLLLAHTMDDGTAAASFIAMDVNYGIGTTASAYGFSTSDLFITNTAAAYTGAAANTRIALYGLGAEPWQRYSRFETRAFPLIQTSTTQAPQTLTYDRNSGTISQTVQSYKLLSGLNDLLIRPGAIGGVSTNDTLVGRVAVTPADVRIEASLFAEQGSFFVIPGPWFNPNPNDTHFAYAERIRVLGGGDAAIQQARRERLENYGTAPEAPFYGEPLDVRLTVVGSVAENLPPPIAVQSEWVRKWGWIPVRQGATGTAIPRQHVSATFDKTKDNYVPNLTIQYDPILATGRVNNLNQPDPIRVDAYQRPLPPMPRLPVSPKLSYFGEL